MTTASDDFNRANESPVGAPWTSVIGGGANLSSNALTSTATTDRRSLYSGTWGNDHIAHVNVGNLTSGVNYAAVCVRLATTGGGRGYEVYTDGVSGAGHTEIARWDAGAATVLASVATTFVNGDKLSLRIAGTTLTVYKNDVSVGTTTDSTYSSGNPGCGAYQSGTVDNFSADDGAAASSLPLASRSTLQAVNRAGTF